MAKSRGAALKSTRSQAKSSRPIGPQQSPIAGINPKYHTPIFIGLILLALLVFFGDVIFGNKLFGANDNVSWESFRPYIDSMDSKGEAPLWIPYIFSGMPAFASYLVTGDRWWDLTMKIIYSSEHIFGVVNYPVMRVVFHYFIFGIGMYLLMRTKKAARSTSFFVSLAALFSTWIIVFIMIGHNTKIMVLMTIPFIFLCMEKLMQRWSLLYAALLVLSVHVAAAAGHLQTAFYFTCGIGIYLLVNLIQWMTTKDKALLNGSIRVAAVALIGAGFAYGAELDRTLTVQEYLPYSTRGAAAISEDPQHEEAALDVGHGYEYATNWSYSPEEMITYVVPAYFGFGKLEYSGPETRNQEVLIPTYWGQMPFTDAAHYMGIAVLILGLFGMWMNRSNRFVQALAAIGLFGLILSFGKNLPILYDLFYNYFPGFSKFRAPSQSLVMLEFVFPILAGFGIESLIALHKSGRNPKVEKSLRYMAVGFGGFLLLGAIGSSIFKSGYLSSIAEARGSENFPMGIQEFVFDTMITDWLFSGFFGVAVLLMMYWYLRGNLTATVFKMALLGILVVDLWRIDYRMMDAEPAEDVMAVFRPNDVDAFLAKDTTQYRIMDLTAGNNVNLPARHFQQHVLGYSSAKMRAYQDLLDIAGNGNAPTSPTALNILNTKYIIAGQPIAENLKPVYTSQTGNGTVYENLGAMPRAWFVDRVETASDLEVLQKIRDNAFDPAQVAFTSEPLAEQPDPAPTPTPTDPADTTAPSATPATPSRGTVSVTSYEPLRITMNASTPRKSFMVISEMNYPPSWRATIDGEPAEIIKTNYIHRGLMVPAGDHTIEMFYVSEGFQTGKYLSLGLNLLLLGALGLGIFLDRRGKGKEPTPEEADPEHNAPEIDEEDV